MKKLILLFTALLMIHSAVWSQVKIGENAAPTSGAILDLNSPVQGGLLLPNVNITDLGKIPSDFTDTSVQGQDVVSALAGMIVWNTNTTTGVGVYMWDGDNWKLLQTGSGTVCTNASVTPASTAANQPVTVTAGNTLTLTVTGAGSPVLSYQWYLGGSAISGATNATYTKTAVAGDAGNYYCRVTSSCNGSQTTSALFVVTVNNPVNPPDVSGNYSLSGKTCFDVNQGNYNATCGLAPQRVNDFASTHSFTYTFNNSTAFTGLTFSLSDPNALASVTYSGSTATITFVSNVNTLAAGTDKTTAKKLTLVANFTDNTSTAKSVSLDIAVQDCSCGCTVNSTLPAGHLTFLCYNLGVPAATKSWSIAQQMSFATPTAAATTDSTVYGGLYQWGRWTDGHQMRTSTTTAGPVAAAGLDANGQVLSTNAAYGHFVTNSTSPYDWRPQNDNMWNGTYPTNNPCPAGYRIPTQAEWASIYTSTTAPNTWTWQAASASATGGWAVKPDGTNITLFLPAAGYRNNAGTLNYAGTNGYYWSSTVNGTNAYNLNFGSTSVNPASYSSRAYGFSVRCVAE